MPKIIKAIVRGKLIVKRDEIPPKIRDILKAKLTWENPEYKDAIFRHRPTHDREGRILIPRYISAIEYREKSGQLHIAREYWPEFESICNNYGYKVDFKDRRVINEENPIKHVIKLWKPQKRAVKELLDPEYGHQGVLQAPCGSGKTVILLYLIATLGQNSLILAHTNDLIEQWTQYIRKFLNIEPGIIQGDKIDIQQVTIASVMTLKNRKLTKEFLDNWGLVVLDEAHHAPADSFYVLLTEFPAYYRFGATATPSRADKLEDLLFAVCGPIVAKITYNELEKGGLIVRPSLVPVSTNFRYPYRGIRTYHAMIRSLVSDNTRNNLIVKNIMNNKDHAQLVLSKQIDHLLAIGNVLARRDPSLRIEVLIAGGTKKDRKGNVIRNIKMSTDERKEVIRKMRDGEIDVILATSLADEGLDIPRLDRIHLTFPTRAEGKVEQQVGRIQRTFPGKKDAIVYDYVDTQITLLYDQWRDRRKVYKSMGIS